MTPEQFLRKADNFEGTAFVAFELGGRLLAIGRREDGGRICLYERDHEAEPMGYRHVLATFGGKSEAARAGAFIASMGEGLERAREELEAVSDELVEIKFEKGMLP